MSGNQERGALLYHHLAVRAAEHRMQRAYDVAARMYRLAGDYATKAFDTQAAITYYNLAITQARKAAAWGYDYSRLFPGIDFNSLDGANPGLDCFTLYCGLLAEATMETETIIR